jgi:hypothetical protein
LCHNDDAIERKNKQEEQMSQQNGFIKTAATLLIVSSTVSAMIGTITNFAPTISDPTGAPFLWVGVMLVVLHVFDVIGILGFWASGASGDGSRA